MSPYVAQRQTETSGAVVEEMMQMGSIRTYETAHGRRYSARYRTPERQQTDKRGFLTMREAKLFLASVEVAKATGDYIERDWAHATIEELGRPWLEAKRSRLKPSSYRALEDALRVYVLPRWGKTPVSSITHSAVRAWVAQLADGTAKTDRRYNVRTRDQGARHKSASVVIRAHGVLAAVLDLAVKDRRIRQNPARGVDNLPRKHRRLHRYLSHKEVERLAQASGANATFVYVAAYTGLRWGELTALRVADVDSRRRRLTVSENAVRVGSQIHVGSPKSHEMRSVPYPRFLEDAIAELREGKSRDMLLFGNGRDYFGRPRSSANSRSWFMTALEAAEIDRMTIHDLRHTAASLAVSSGANVKVVQRLLGHASASMTLDVYADLFDEDLDAVADSLDAARTAALES